MATSIVVDDDEQQIADLIKQMRRLRARLTTGQVRGTHDEFTVAATPETTFTLTYIPVDGTCAMFVNGLEQTEDTDYTVDYDTAVVTFVTALTTGDEIDFRYLITDWLVARSLPEDTGVGPGAFIAGAGNGGTGTSATVTMPGGLAAGDLLIAAVQTFGAGASIVTPSGWTHEGNDADLAVFSKISDGTETGVTMTGFSGGWAALLQIYRGDNIQVASSAFGPSASTLTTCDLPTAAVVGEPLLVGIWGACKTFSGSISITPPGTTSNLTTGTEPGRYIAAASEDLTGVSTTPALTATASASADAGWGAAVLTVAIDL